MSTTYKKEKTVTHCCKMSDNVMCDDYQTVKYVDDIMLMKFTVVKYFYDQIVKKINQ